MLTADPMLAQVEEMGRKAALIGDPVSTCPYAQQDTPSERELARVWVAGYLSARPPTSIDYDTPPSTQEGV